ncbi:MAG: ATPase, T2SS/T4P/T4SS family [SAR324 cluster bacterium]|nr:type II secretion system protein GspE [Pseudomonadota bacterium]MDP6091754.1 ATPase, T2SS/T4P/T4SS family [SAR324 cluster bacterium]MDP6247631.1 ATPase, T2SS/T4P/T4SS family [SAR324 cluster bacterium]MDP7334037.1 ATPase, T2SS/T4P/T4SS family [SAR324 cluster bacterium]MDP7499648.1 ATPase, T2SS/T4P/T4SS family [SAR324 cluster bacterium]
MLEFEAYHPIIKVLVSQFDMDSTGLENLHEQLLGYRHEPKKLKELLIKYKLTSETLYQQALAAYYDLEYQETIEEAPAAKEFTSMIPIRYAKRFMFFPVRWQKGILEVAVDDPAESQAMDDLGRRCKCHVQALVTTPQSLLDLINRSYDESSASTADAVDQLDTVEEFESIMGIEEPEDLLEATDEEPVKRLVNSLLWQAAKEEASDIHIDPAPGETQVRYRIDGILHQITIIPRQVHVTVVNRIKVMSRLDIAQKGLPQDGRSMVLIAGKKIDIRVSTIPTVHGEKIVMRLLYQDEKLMKLEHLGLLPEVLQPYQKMIQRSGGIVLVTGPTGSGKTTTLYATLACIDHRSRNVITIEEPVEYKLAGYSQIEVNPKLGLTFAHSLRSVLRQDPDVIMVGEMRDSETAQIAIQAALTGHLVFSTVHTNSAPATVTRLIDMGIEPFLVSSTIIGILSQRLVRKICLDCRNAYEAHPEELRELGINHTSSEPIKLFKGTGCGNCRETGYRGRIGVHELLIINDRVKNVIMTNSDSQAIKQKAVVEGMKTLKMDGTDKALKGFTTAEEVLTVTYEDESEGFSFS